MTRSAREAFVAVGHPQPQTAMINCASVARESQLHNGRTKPYLGGKPPLEWLIAASLLPGKALAVVVALAFEHGIRPSPQLVPPKRVLEAMRITRGMETRALANLERAGLVKVDRHTGRRPRVLLLWNHEEVPL